MTPEDAPAPGVPVSPAELRRMKAEAAQAEDDGPLVAAVEFERDGEVVDTMKIDPPAGSFSRRMEKITKGVLTHMADDLIMYEVGTDGKRLD